MFGTREEWLREAIKKLEARVFQSIELMGDKPLYMPEKWAVSCGWSKGASQRAIGVCVDSTCSVDGTTHIFIIPTKDNPMPIPPKPGETRNPHCILGTLCHEMVHAIVGVEAKHGARFNEVRLQIGLAGKATQCTIEPGTFTYEACELIAEELGPYPHAAMVLIKKPAKLSEWVRWKSKNFPKYTILINTKSVIRYGMPRDPKGDEMIPVDPDKVFGVKQDHRQERLPHVDR